MQKGIYGFPAQQHQSSPYWPYRPNVLRFRSEKSGAGEFVVPQGYGTVVIFFCGSGGGGGSWVVAGAEAGGGGSAGAAMRRFRNAAGFRFKFSIGAQGNGGNPAGQNGGTSTLSVYAPNGRLIQTTTIGGGFGAPGGTATGGAAGATPTEAWSTLVDTDLLYLSAGIAGDHGATYGNDVGGYGGQTFIRLMDPFDNRMRGIGSPYNNGPTINATAPGAGGGGGVGTGIGSNGKFGCFFAAALPIDESN